MKKDKLWCNDTTLCFGRLIRLYFMAMNHSDVYACLRVLYAQTGMSPTKSAICNVLRDFYTKPRTLKQMARVVIYNAVGQRPALRVNKLPLPAALREYLVNFEPWKRKENGEKNVKIFFGTQIETLLKEWKTGPFDYTIVDLLCKSSVCKSVINFVGPVIRLYKLNQRLLFLKYKYNSSWWRHPFIVSCVVSLFETLFWQFLSWF